MNLESDVRSNIILTGFMGTGKTTVGKLLAGELGYEFVDTDDLIQVRQGMTIPDIFSKLGEDAFRQMEADLAVELSNKEGLVISTGGRMMLDPHNVTALSRGGRIFCLVATPEEILTRLEQDKAHPRPLLEVPNPSERIIELYQQREKGYKRFPQVMTTQRQPGDITEDLLGLIQKDPKRFAIENPISTYDYIVGGGLIPFIRQLTDVDGMLVVITDENVGEIYAPSCGDADHVITIPAGKQFKNWKTVLSICDQLIEIGFDRNGTIVALGGSTVGDIAGFVAASFMRGVALIQCPTTLLSMVDTSVGGKVGIDLPQGKNLLGYFKQPKAVIADIATLQTLPKAEFTAGMAEVIKHGLLVDTDLLKKVELGDWSYETNIKQILQPNLQNLVAQAIQVKTAIVQEDPFDDGPRLMLNLGHTVAHAIEQVSHNRIRHGEAVAIGLVAAANLSARLGYCATDTQEKIEHLLKNVGLPTRIPQSLSATSLLEAMTNDKKRVAGQSRMLLMKGIGQVFVSTIDSEQAILETLEDISN